MRLGVLGGTFDPVHIGHLVLAEQAREQVVLDKVLWVPAGDPWRKSGLPVSGADHRLSMLQLAIEGHDAFEAAKAELERNGPSYTVDTLAALREQHGGELFFLLGLDALRDLSNWHDPARLVDLATLGVALRDDRRLTDRELDELLPGLSRRVRWIHMPRLDVSATDLRLRAAEGRSLRYLVPAAVEAYIRRHKLYLRA